MNGKESITDCPSVNDGSWHHIAVSWTSTTGAWRVYIDGKLSDRGSALSVGSAIPGMTPSVVAKLCFLFFLFGGGGGEHCVREAFCASLL